MDPVHVFNYESPLHAKSSNSNLIIDFIYCAASRWHVLNAVQVFIVWVTENWYSSIAQKLFWRKRSRDAAKYWTKIFCNLKVETISFWVTTKGSKTLIAHLCNLKKVSWKLFLSLWWRSNTWRPHAISESLLPQLSEEFCPKWFIEEIKQVSSVVI